MSRTTTKRLDIGRYEFETDNLRFEVVSRETHSEGQDTDRGWHVFRIVTDGEGDCGTNRVWLNDYYQMWFAIEETVKWVRNDHS